VCENYSGNNKTFYLIVSRAESVDEAVVNTTSKARPTQTVDTVVKVMSANQATAT